MYGLQIRRMSCGMSCLVRTVTGAVIRVADDVDLDVRWKRCGFVYAGVPPHHKVIHRKVTRCLER